ncbi:MAG: DUF2961 domain-containing protein, partial [Armatimonadetes bacterium]|nr:DUF2961 domain-containing protein [Armatimonadota bacterium]
IIGTGTEDYFTSGWDTNSGVDSAPYHGVTIKDEISTRITTPRWHNEDPLPFKRTLRFTIEHGGTNDVTADYTSVAYWYQTHPRPAFPPLPRDHMPTEPEPVPRIAGMIEGESLLSRAKATPAAPLTAQLMDAWEGEWSGLGQLWWRPNRIGEQMTLSFNAPEAREYELVGYFTQAPDYGDVRVTVNGRTLSPVVRGYAQNVRPTGPISFGRIPLNAGSNAVVFEVVGKDDRSTGYLFGLDGFVLRP